ncbi:hypothetical protein pEaSNUABM27_00019 [Erwinia phage pEa_SNUABM_27]|nr:hypothetical protein pEaSNUABM27_00019 [Erwinia phage pEa_SNUABM_27]
MPDKIDLEYQYRRLTAIIDKVKNGHLVKGKVVADAGEGLAVDLDLTSDELLAILHQRAGKVFNQWRNAKIERHTHPIQN